MNAVFRQRVDIRENVDDIAELKKRNLWKMNVKINNFQSITSLYIEHVATCIYLKDFEKRKFKM